jgi:hypothetical protein
LVSYGTFPDDSDTPPHYQQLVDLLSVPFHIPVDLAAPELGIRCRPPERGAVVVMPKAPVDHYHRPIPSEHDVRPTGEVLGMQAEAETCVVQQRTNDNFRSGVRLPDPGHHPASRCRIDDVRQFSP